jgi:GR25 family glycosyltransferase involved in LPS biosynthesis
MNPTLFVIHDQKRTDRYNTLVSELQSQHIHPDDIHWMPAVKANNAIAGISQAHRACVQKAKDLGLAHVTILEDDIKFTCEFSFRRYMDAFEKLPDDWDLYFGGAYTLIQKRKVHPLFLMVTDIAGLHCYTIRRSFFDRFLEAPDTYHIDRWLIARARAKAYILYPFIAVQYDGFSDQQGRMIVLKDFHKSTDLYHATAYETLQDTDD